MTYPVHPSYLMGSAVFTDPAPMALPRRAFSSSPVIRGEAHVTTWAPGVEITTWNREAAIYAARSGCAAARAALRAEADAMSAKRRA